MPSVTFVPKPLKVEALYFGLMVIATMVFTYVVWRVPINGVSLFWLGYYLVERVYWRVQTTWVPRPKAPLPEPKRYTRT